MKFEKGKIREVRERAFNLYKRGGGGVKKLTYSGYSKKYSNRDSGIFQARLKLVTLGILNNILN
jgi:hypothetical protein